MVHGFLKLILNMEFSITGMVPETLKNVFKKHIPIIGNFQDSARTHAIIECKGRCPIGKYHYFNDKTKYKKSFSFPLKGENENFSN